MSTAICCTKTGPGYSTPQEAIQKGTREKIVYVTCSHPKGAEKSDYLAVVDVDPSSANYCQVISRCFTKNYGDELHHTGWNACSSCHSNPNCSRNRMVVLALKSDRIYIMDTTDERQPKLHQTIDGEEMRNKWNVTTPHTSHCLPSGEIMIGFLGDANEEAKGSFILLKKNESTDFFEVSGFWTEKFLPFGYDFWYQPRFDVMISTELGAPKAFKKGYDPQDVADHLYGKTLNFFNWSKRELIQQIDLGDDGLLPLEIRFLHDPNKSEGYVPCALDSSIIHFSLQPSGLWDAQKVIKIDAIPVKDWILPEMPGIITDILTSMDDKYLYFSNWVQGDIRQYDISDTANPRLVGQVFVGGSLFRGSKAKRVDGEESLLRERTMIKGIGIRGGPQMLQLSLDGKRLYVTTSLYSGWDQQFYPELIEKGAMMLMVDVNTETGGLKLNADFLVDFEREPEGPVLAHEIRYPGGDCTSDIFI